MNDCLQKVFTRESKLMKQEEVEINAKYFSDKQVIVHDAKKTLGNPYVAKSQCADEISN